MAQVTQPTEHDGRGRSWSSSGLQSAALVAAIVCLELVPLEAWLIMLAAYNTGDPTRTSAPFWLMAGCVLIAWAIRRTSRRGNGPLDVKVMAPVVVFELLVLLRVSPDVYGSTAGGPLDLSWLAEIGSDIANNSPHIGATLTLAMLVVYLNWRGLSLGRRPLVDADALARLRVGMGVLVVAVVTATLVPDRSQQTIIGALALLLPLEVFAGLLGAALGRAAEQRALAGRAIQDGADRYPWLRTSVVLSAVVIGATLAVSVVLNYTSVGALLQKLGPVGVAMTGVVTWVTDQFAQLLFFVFGGFVSWLQNLTKNAKPFQIQGPAKPCVPSAQVHCPSPHVATLPPFWQHLAAGLTQLLVLVVIAAVFLYVLRATFAISARRAERMADEEREALDGRGLLRAQLRDLFARRHELGAAPDTLARGSVRYLYREVLRAAAALGVAREAAETPDEYAERLSQTPPIATSTGGESADLGALSQAYNAARYADREPGRHEREPLAQGADRIRQRLRLRRG